MICSLLAGAVLAASTLLPVQAQAADTPVGRNGQLHVCGTKLCNERDEPVQLRGMSTHGLQWYANCLKTASLDALANDWKADILRISMYVQEGGYETDPRKFVGTHGWASLGVSDGRTEADVVDNPVNATNLMYTFHFYAASHQQEYLDALSRAADKIPLFVTEFGTQTYTGDGGNDFTWSQKYLDFLDSKQIGWTNWNFSDDFRSGAVFKEGTCAGDDFTGTSMLKPAGVWIRDHIRNRTVAAATTDVSTSAELKAALTGAKPGDTIKLADGTYSGNFKTTVSGTSSNPITLTGSANAVLTAGGGYGLHLNGASYWNVRGITVTGGQKGIMIDSATHVTVDGVTVHRLDMEGVHFRNSSTYGVIKNSRIYDTGNDGRGMGEGVYVGSAGGTADKSDHVQIVGNTIGPDVGGEAVDLKEGTTGGLVSGNSFDGRGLTGANFDDSWIDVKGNNYVIENNTGKNTTNNGYETHTQQSGWGCGTVFRGNKSDLTGATGSGRYAFNITNYNASSCKVTVDRSNTMTGGKALTNPGIPVT